MKKNIRNYFQKNAEFKWTIEGTETNVKIQIGDETKIGPHFYHLLSMIEDIRKENDCLCRIINSNKDYSFTIEFFK